MRRFSIILVLWLVVATGVAMANSYTLTDGTVIVGDPISMNEQGVQFRLDNQTDLPRTSWDKLTPATLLDLNAHAKTPAEQALLAPLVDYLPQPAAERKEIVVNAITPPPRPTGHLGLLALFASPLGWIILLVLYGANLFTAYEVAIYRYQSVSTVCGLAAIPFFGVFSPIFFLAKRGKVLPDPAEIKAAEPTSVIPIAGGTAAPPPQNAPAAPQRKTSTLTRTVAEEAAAPPPPAATTTLPEPIVFSRGEFLFNRRFFETKFTGFFRVIPAEADKDLVLLIKSSRGEFVGRHIARATPAEIYLQVFKNEATAEEMIPFTEILEVQIRHKDSL